MKPSRKKILAGTAVFVIAFAFVDRRISQHIWDGYLNLEDMIILVLVALGFGLLYWWLLLLRYKRQLKQQAQKKSQ